MDVFENSFIASDTSTSFNLDSPGFSLSPVDRSPVGWSSTFPRRTSLMPNGPSARTIGKSLQRLSQEPLPSATAECNREHFSSPLRQCQLALKSENALKKNAEQEYDELLSKFEELVKSVDGKDAIIKRLTELAEQNDRKYRQTKDICEEMENALEEMEATNKVMNDELDVLRGKASARENWEAQVIKLRTENCELQTTLEVYRTNFEKAAQEKKQRQKELSNAAATASSQQKEMLRLREELERAQSEIEEKTEYHAQKESIWEDTKAALDSELETTLYQMSSLAGVVVLRGREVEDLTNREEGLTLELAATKAAIVSLEADNTKLQEEKKQLADRSEEHLNQLELMRQSLKDHAQSLVETRADSENARNSSSQWKSLCDQHISSITRLEDDFAALRSVNDGLFKELESSRSAFEDMKTRNGSLEIDVAMLGRLKDELSHELELSRSALEETKAQNENLEVNVAVFRSSKDNLSQELELSRLAVKHLKVQNETEEKRFCEELTKLEKRCLLVENEILLVTNQRDVASENVRSLQLDVVNLNADLKNSLDAREIARRELLHHLHRIHCLESDLLSERKKYADVSREYAATQERLESSVKFAQSRAEPLRNRIMELEAEVARLESLLEKMQHGSQMFSSVYSDFGSREPHSYPSLSTSMSSLAQYSPMPSTIGRPGSSFSNMSRLSQLFPRTSGEVEADLDMESASIPAARISSHPAGHGSKKPPKGFKYSQSSASRAAELERRNKIFKPHLQSSYPAETYNKDLLGNKATPSSTSSTSSPPFEYSPGQASPGMKYTHGDGHASKGQLATESLGTLPRGDGKEPAVLVMDTPKKRKFGGLSNLFSGRKNRGQGGVPPVSPGSFKRRSSRGSVLSRKGPVLATTVFPNAPESAPTVPPVKKSEAFDVAITPKKSVINIKRKLSHYSPVKTHYPLKPK